MSTTFTITPGGSLQGTLQVPGDKSISHRSLMLGAIAEGETRVSGFLAGEDTLATMRAMRAMGVDIEQLSSHDLRIQGVGMRGLEAPEGALDLGNSGTSMRLMCGLLAGQSFDVTLTGDASLSRRPMRRVADPLALMGAEVECNDGGTPPLTIHGGRSLTAIEYQMPVASAQVKSCVLLAGLYAEGRTTVIEPGPSRDHTERMLEAFGYEIRQEENRVSLSGGYALSGTEIQVPADISSAAFPMVAALVTEGSDVVLKDVGINPTRIGIIEILTLMGADIVLENPRTFGAEPVADIHVRHSQLTGIEIPEHLVPLAIDEFPVVFVAASQAEGETLLTGAEELRVKESDRIQTMADGLQALGIDAQPRQDGMLIKPGQLSGGEVDSHGDHRIAMSFAVAGMRATAPIIIRDCDNVNTSFPDFVQLMAGAGMRLVSES